MEKREHLCLAEQDSSEVLPSLIKSIAEVASFECFKEHTNLSNQYQPTDLQSFSALVTGSRTATIQSQSGLSESKRVASVSISMPSSPTEVRTQYMKGLFVRCNDETIFNNDIANSPSTLETAGSKLIKQSKFHSQPIATGSAFDEAVACGKFPNRSELPPRNPRIDKLKDKRFDSFKTWSGKLERQLSHLLGKSRETEPEENILQNAGVETLPVDRYFDALEGPELDTLRWSHEC